MPRVPTIYIDADGCPVKEEVYRVARRYHLKVLVVCNRAMNVPLDELVERIVVGSRFNAADDWIAERAGEGDVAVTADIVLAARCLERGARVLGPKGHELTEDSIGTALADRELKEQLRAAGLIQGGPAPMAKEDRSRFLARLDQIVQALRSAH